MLTRKNRTMEIYKKVGAEMRLFKTLGGNLLVDGSQVLTAQDQDRLWRALRQIDKVCSNAEDNMFRDYPELSGEYIDVFYGDTDQKPRHGVDEEIINKAKEVVNELFKDERKDD